MRDEYPESVLILAARDRKARGGRLFARSQHRAAPRRRRLYLRRRVGDDRIDRRQAGLPRNRPPYIAEVGLFGRPTLDQNVETLYWVRDIVDKGADWFADQAVAAARACALFGIGPGEESRRQAGPGRGHGARTDRGILRRHGGWPRFRPICPAARRAASCRQSMADLPLDFGTLEKYGCFVGSQPSSSSPTGTT